MGQKARSAAVLRVSLTQRLARLSRSPRSSVLALYPGVQRSTPLRNRPAAVVSIIYVMSVIAAGWMLVVPRTLMPALLAGPRFVDVIVLVVFSMSIGACALSYLLAALVAPGPVPDAWKPVYVATPVLVPPPPDAPSASSSMTPASAGHDQPAAEAAGGGVKVGPPQAPPAALADGSPPRFCRTCRVYKPRRTHHCSTCGSCALMLDHHCPFVGNACVGFGNRKFFVLFLYYATLSCGMVAVIAPAGLIRDVDALTTDATAGRVAACIALLLGYMLCALHAIVLACFAAFHTYLAVRNRTTVEHSDPTRDDLSRYNRGPMRNWCAIFGTRPALWFVPVSLGCEGDGVRWRSVDDSV
jgi:palmitoyltransferase ZDHHC2/15/20